MRSHLLKSDRAPSSILFLTMPLSNCSNCKYYSDPLHSKDIACSLQPAYASMWLRLKGLDEYSQNCLPIDDCRDFDLHPDLQPVTITLTLTSIQWQQIAYNNSILTLREQLQPYASQLDLNNNRDEWIEVDSSCLSAIAFSDSILKIRFVRGSIYQYSGVSLDTFNALLHTSSQGRYFNQYIKDHYPTQLVSD